MTVVNGTQMGPTETGLIQQRLLEVSINKLTLMIHIFFKMKLILFVV